jgi:5S rRNA maturation endonuclease (ribonuclease M5)
MSRNIHWLLVVEGRSDIKPYKNFLKEKTGDVFDIKYAGGKSSVLDLNKWKNNKKDGTIKLDDLENYYIQADFKGVLLIIDADMNGAVSDIIKSDTYKRCIEPSISFIETPPCFDVKVTPYGNFIHIDTLKGQKMIPIYGIAVPPNTQGSIETVLLDTYGYPATTDDHEPFRLIAKNIGEHWCNDSNDFFSLDKNGKTKADKFTYNAFLDGIKIFKDELSIKDITSLSIPAIDLIAAIIQGTV